MSETAFDLAIVGSGGAAFGAALRASELGANVAMIERSTLGGTCVNIGCIPSKTLLRAAEAVHRAQSTPFDGIDVRGTVADFRAVVAQKARLVEELRQAKYADVLSATPNVRLLRGHAEFVTRGELRVGSDVLRAHRLIVATGARPYVAPIPGLQEAGFLTSTDALSVAELPKSLIVVGGRYIALELAQAFSRLGSRVTVLQRSAHLLPTEDADVTDALASYLRAEGIEILTGVDVRRVQRDGDERVVEIAVGDERRTLRAAHLLMATGRQPNTDDLGLDRIGVMLDGRGAIRVDEYLQTTAPSVYAAGDVKGDPAFVYTAAYEGRLAAENALTEENRARDYTALPWVMFSDPQLAVVGLDEQRALRAGLRVDVAKLPLSHVPRALAARDTRGFIKLVKEHKTDRLVGASIVAPEAGDLIMEPALAIRHGIGVSALANAFHPYLTQIEGIKLAAQAFSKDVAKLSCCAA
jgi:mercuric reductase